jgi:paired amphipathic helix protein Sin3a
MIESHVEDALEYLDQVKIQFGDSRPQIYNEFLDIMKTFKSQQIDTPSVIKRISSLFDGNHRLLLGFNIFLPDGYKIEIPIDNHGRLMAAVFRTPGQAGSTLINSEQAQQLVEQDHVGFDYAMNFITTIKRRFGNESDTYKKFFEILHTYQKKGGTKKVIDGVAILFADHPDLLKYFKYFLPDVVKEQAKVYLDAVVAEQRKNALDAKKAVMNQSQTIV